MADLTLILGTSLTVFPFASLPELVTRGKPRVLFNMERVGSLGSRPDDVLALGQCDEGVRKLAKALGWDEELDTLWRNVVGDKEADRQSGDATKQHDELEDEVNKLTEGVESALKLDEASEKKDESAGSASKSGLVNKGGEQDEGEILKIPEPKENLLDSTEKKVEQSAFSDSKPEEKQEEEQNDKAAGPSLASAEKESRTGEKEGAKQPDPEKAAL
uniref:Deacetylase sirtuin-type domain-containing protein n=1 Tax=Bionectria ochroleuca TaxID=29856 RepID=A0A0B7K064_BIOOC